ncbi:MAG TPA: YkgJ family cysteine cluster protein [Kiritimatiellia bacterium]|nr:YkgJ family cysteine cluster protein [Kiritimatiellia bacterium]HPJ56963.1 YkgJ family cysteine cluster protein [Kiritimatiellia bacterium]HPR68450.1 YkgJ family cysteine cluster protein [Kiritimatiellia bacterium]HRX05955.1 YkgJ family cysteine cluster protein [Kiritimatiellia bacterium]
MDAPLDAFECRRCGACCRWPGSVLLEPADIESAAAFLGLTPEEFIERHAGLARNRAQLTLKEAPGGACGFLDDNDCCRIYPARPRQCRDFPRSWRVEGCPGLDRRA